MPKYTTAWVKCYCGAEHIVTVGQRHKCGCGCVLHTQQKKGGGRAWGRVKDAKTYPHRHGKIDAQFIQ